ncbi:PEGA domain-containing protein [Myxococcota bacterium]|nr:PEGA domain-containing protein [Myxococcota bacterium]
MSVPSGPALGRAKLLRILALPEDASDAVIRAAAVRLRAWLEARLVEHPPRSAEARAALVRELIDLAASTDYWTTPAPGSRRAGRVGRSAGRAGDAPGPLLLLVGGLTGLALLIAHAAGFRVTRADPDEAPVVYGVRARVLIEGRALAGATLRIFDADRTEILEERPAEGADVELEPGRYALEVSRADCPDPWTRSVFLEPDSVHRYEAVVCAGQGNLVIHANTESDRVRIDELDVGHSGNRAHRLAVGEHTIRVDKAGFRPFEARVRVGPDETVELRAELVRLGEAEAKAGRPMPVSHVAPSLPPIDAKAVEPFGKAELKAGIEPPAIEPADLGLPKRGAFLAREGLPALPDGGSTAWHDRVSAELRERFDQDRSGEIDSLSESEAISCSVWREIERDFDRGGLGLSLAHYYGFDGSEWHPGALAVARAHRSAVYAKMRECGLDP